jgi:phosphatidylglycerophosphate synthase
MGFIAVVSAGESEPGQPPPGLGVVGGISLLERQVRAALDAGAHGVIVVAAALPAEIAGRLAAEDRCVRAPTAAALAGRLATGAETGPTETGTAETGTPHLARDVLAFAPGLLVDDRLVAAVVADRRKPLLLAFGDTAPKGAERLDSDSHWGGIARLPAMMVHDVAASLGDWELMGTLVRTAVEAGAARVQAESLPTYAPARRRDAPLIWARPLDEPERAAATNSLIAASQKGCLDWPARFIHPPIEDGLVRLLLPTRVTPNMVTMLTGILGLAAIILFAVGELWWGLGLVLVVGPLDGVDGKLARTRHEFSRWGDLEHVLDKIMEYGWFLALGFWFSGEHGLAAWLVAGGIVGFALAEAISGEFFRRFTGRQLDDWGPFERRFRLVAGRRNTYFWTLIPFAAFGLWWPGFLTLLAYAAVTSAVTQWRFLRALASYGRDTSAAVEENFARTAYAFLPKGDAASR